MGEEYNMDAQDTTLNDQGNRSADGENLTDSLKDFADQYDESFEDDESGNFRNNRGRGNFRNRGRGGPPPGWMNGPPMRFRGRGYGPAGPPMRGRSFFRTRGGPRFSNAPNFDGSWGPMGPPPPGMMGGPPPFGPPPGMMPPGGPMGPPPNMMGQPPPFGGPPNMPPPNMQTAPELWVETKSEDGKSYYYHARTRETTWTRPPEGPACKVISQQEVEAMASAGQMQGMQGQNMPMSGPMGMPGPMGGMPPMGMMPQMMPPTQMPPSQMQPSQMQPAQMQPSQMQPSQMQPTQMQPSQMQATQMPPSQMQSTQMQPSQMQPAQMQSAQMQSAQMQSAQMQSAQMQSAQMQPSQMQPSQMQPSQMQPSQMQPTQMPPSQMQPSQMPPSQQPPAGAVPSYMTQPPPWVKEGMKEGGLAPEEAGGARAAPDEAPPGDPVSNQYPVPNQGYQNGPASNFNAAPASYPGGMMGGMPAQPPAGFPGGWGGWGAWPPPLVANPPPNLGNAAMPDAGAGQQIAGAGAEPPGVNPEHMQLDTQQQQHQQHLQQQHQHQQRQQQQHHQQQQQNIKDVVIPPELEAAAAEWSAHCAPDGRAYYYHAGKQESVWEKPKPVKELEELQAKVQAEKDRAEKIKIIQDREIKPNLDIIDVETHEMEKAAAEAKALAEAERAAQEEKEKQERERLEKEREEREKAEKEKAEKEKIEKEKEKAKADKSRPISSTPISGTPWCVVWTGDGRVFFYNPTAHSSVWERPAQLAGRADVDRVLAQPPALDHDQSKEQPAIAAAATTATSSATATAAPSKAANGELKRAADSDSDDSEAEPIKKSKPEDKAKPAQIDLGKEAAIEAEVRAARERGVVPHSQRLRSFLAMLHEKQVSAFSTWEKELHKIVFDPRYLMLNSKERRQVFDQYVRERAEEERKEKKNRLLAKKQAFRTLLEEAKLHSKSSFTEYALKHGRDERFKAIEKARERELYFNEYIVEVRKKEKEDKEKKRDQAKLEYFALLKEKGVDRHARFSELKKKIDSEPRYKAVEGGAAREDYFREYCKQLKDDRRKDKDGKERERSSKKEKKEKERDKEKEKDVKKEKKDKKGEQPKVEETPAEETETAEPAEVTESAEVDEAAKEKEARAQASIKEREREVQRALATSMRDRDKEREYHKRDEAVQHFNALLADLVRNPELSWRDAKKQLKKDHRYNLAELLLKDDKERLFGQHTNALASKRREKLRVALEELGVSGTAPWKTVRDKLRAEGGAPPYSSDKQMERDFRDYQRDKQAAAKTAFRQLLVESRGVTHRSLAAVRESSAALLQIHQAIKHSARYTALEHVPEERDSIIMSYLEELEKKGPPPPPTATEPARRAKQ